MAQGWLSRVLAFALLAGGVIAPAPAAVYGETAGWTRQFGTTGADRAEGVALDATGDVYVAGWTLGTLPGEVSSGTYDAFVRKYDPAGAELWTHQFGSFEKDRARGVATDGAGNAYVVGETYGSLPGQTSAGGFDAFIRKYDSAGNELWTHQFGGSGGDAAWGVAVEPGGAAYVVGSTGGSVPGQTSAGGFFDAFVRKYAADGNELWTRQFGTAEADGARGVALDRAGAVLVVGNTGGSLPGQASSGELDAFVRKYDPAGKELWTQQFGGLRDDYAVAVALDAWGTASVVGSTDDVLPDQGSAGNTDAFVRGYEGSGVQGWTRQFGSSMVDDASGIAIDQEGNGYVAGNTEGTLPDQTSAGKGDVFVRRYDRFGDVRWTLQFGSPSWDTASGVVVDGVGNVYVVGETFDALPGQTSAGQRDAFLMKIPQ